MPVVVLTGRQDWELANRALRAGAKDCLVEGEFSGRLLQRSMRYAVERKVASEEAGRQQRRSRIFAEHIQEVFYLRDMDPDPRKAGGPIPRPRPPQDRERLPRPRGRRPGARGDRAPSVGIVLHDPGAPGPGEDATAQRIRGTDLIRRADRAMFRVKTLAGQRIGIAGGEEDDDLTRNPSPRRLARHPAGDSVPA